VRTEIHFETFTYTNCIKKKTGVEMTVASPVIYQRLDIEIPDPIGPAIGDFGVPDLPNL